jgi:hypothetical protein
LGCTGVVRASDIVKVFSRKAERIFKSREHFAILCLYSPFSTICSNFLKVQYNIVNHRIYMPYL